METGVSGKKDVLCEKAALYGGILEANDSCDAARYRADNRVDGNHGAWTRVGRGF